MSSALRVVACSAHPRGYALVSDWVQRNGHELVLLVTLPGAGHYGDGTPSLLDIADDRDVLVTRRLRAVAAPVVAAVEPDLVVSAAFPRRIPAEVTKLPRYGAINLHPAPLPRGRGPCPQRLTYEGDETVGVTVHRTDHEFDSGAILSKRERPLRVDELTPDGLMAAWGELLAVVLQEGAARAIAGEPGEPQDETAATYAARFTDEECLLDWTAPALTLQRQVAALNIMGPAARCVINCAENVVAALRALPGEGTPARPGTLLDGHGRTHLVRAGDGDVEVEISD